MSSPIRPQPRPRPATPPAVTSPGVTSPAVTSPGVPSPGVPSQAEVTSGAKGAPRAARPADRSLRARAARVKAAAVESARVASADRASAERASAERASAERASAAEVASPAAGRGGRLSRGPGRRSRGPVDGGTEPRFDPSSWLGAIVLMAVVAAALWIAQIVNAANDYSLNRFGLEPRTVDGLWGVLAAPLLHASYRDMISDTLPVVLIGWVLLLAGARTWLTVTVVSVVIGGALTWLAAPGDELVLGDSPLVFGWIGYLVARAVLARRIKWILAAIMVLLIFGTLLGELVPVSHSAQSWQSHVCGFVAGVGAGVVLHPRRGTRRASRRTAVS